MIGADRETVESKVREASRELDRAKWHAACGKFDLMERCDRAAASALKEALAIMGAIPAALGDGE